MNNSTKMNDSDSNGASIYGTKSPKIHVKRDFDIYDLPYINDSDDESNKYENLSESDILWIDEERNQLQNFISLNEQTLVQTIVDCMPNTRAKLIDRINEIYGETECTLRSFEKAKIYLITLNVINNLISSCSISNPDLSFINITFSINFDVLIDIVCPTDRTGSVIEDVQILVPKLNKFFRNVLSTHNNTTQSHSICTEVLCILRTYLNTFIDIVSTRSLARNTGTLFPDCSSYDTLNQSSSNEKWYMYPCWVSEELYQILQNYSLHLRSIITKSFYLPTQDSNQKYIEFTKNMYYDIVRYACKSNETLFQSFSFITGPLERIVKRFYTFAHDESLLKHHERFGYIFSLFHYNPLKNGPKFEVTILDGQTLAYEILSLKSIDRNFKYWGLYEESTVHSQLELSLRGIKFTNLLTSISVSTNGKSFKNIEFTKCFILSDPDHKLPGRIYLTTELGRIENIEIKCSQAIEHICTSSMQTNDVKIWNCMIGTSVQNDSCKTIHSISNFDFRFDVKVCRDYIHLTILDCTFLQRFFEVDCGKLISNFNDPIDLIDSLDADKLHELYINFVSSIDPYYLKWCTNSMLHFDYVFKLQAVKIRSIEIMDQILRSHNISCTNYNDIIDNLKTIECVDSDIMFVTDFLATSLIEEIDSKHIKILYRFILFYQFDSLLHPIDITPSDRAIYGTDTLEVHRLEIVRFKDWNFDKSYANSTDIFQHKQLEIIQQLLEILLDFNVDCSEFLAKNNEQLFDICSSIMTFLHPNTRDLIRYFERS